MAETKVIICLYSNMHHLLHFADKTGCVALDPDKHSNGSIRKHDRPKKNVYALE